eukprot:1521241-Prymnesium_polylepis.1
MADVLIVSRKVTAALQKPGRQSDFLNVTLRMQGTNTESPASWSVGNAGDLPGWLQLPRVKGSTDAHAIARGDTDVPIGLVLDATGLRERAAPYTATLNISVRSSVATAFRHELLEVLLSVQALTSFLVWGK